MSLTHVFIILGISAFMVAPIWISSAANGIKKVPALVKKAGNPKNLLPFYAKPPALVDPIEILVGMVCTTLLDPSVVLTSSKPMDVYRDKCRSHEKFNISWDTRNENGVYPSTISLKVFDSTITLSERQREKLATTLEKLMAFEEEKKIQKQKEEAQKKACDLLDKWCGIDSTQVKEV